MGQRPRGVEQIILENGQMTTENKSITRSSVQLTDSGAPQIQNSYLCSIIADILKC